MFDSDIQILIRRNPEIGADTLISRICDGRVIPDVTGLPSVEVIEQWSSIWRLACALEYLRSQSSSDTYLIGILRAVVASLARSSASDRILDIVTSLALIAQSSIVSDVEDLSQPRDKKTHEIQKSITSRLNDEYDLVSSQIDIYCGVPVSADDDNFDEDLYLDVNPDVKSTVLAGAMLSGRFHFDNLGRREGRLVRRYLRIKH